MTTVRNHSRPPQARDTPPRSYIRATPREFDPHIDLNDSSVPEDASEKGRLGQDPWRDSGQEFTVISTNPSRKQMKSNDEFHNACSSSQTKTPEQTASAQRLTEIFSRAEHVIKKINELCNTTEKTISAVDTTATPETFLEETIIEDGETECDVMSGFSATPRKVLSFDNAADDACLEHDSKRDVIVAQRIEHDATAEEHPTFFDNLLFPDGHTPIPANRDRNPVVSPPFTSLHSTPGYDDSNSGIQQTHNEISPRILPSSEEVEDITKEFETSIHNVFAALELEQSVAKLLRTAEAVIDLLRRTNEGAEALQRENIALRERLHQLERSLVLFENRLSHHKKVEKDLADWRGEGQLSSSKMEKDNYFIAGPELEVAPDGYEESQPNTSNVVAHSGAEFVADLSQLMGLESGQLVYLACIMDRYFLKKTDQKTHHR